MRALLILLALPTLAWGQYDPQGIGFQREMDKLNQQRAEFKKYNEDVRQATERAKEDKRRAEQDAAEYARFRGPPRPNDTQKCTLEWVPQPPGQSKKLVCY